jgi:exodeoxyribonuclease VII large subunit
LADEMKGLLAEGRAELQDYYEQVARIEPHRLLGKVTVELNELRSRALAGVTAAMNAKRMELTAQENRLMALDPKSVLKRGYSITLSKGIGRVVRTLADVEVGDDLVTELAGENLIESKVVGKKSGVQ